MQNKKYVIVMVVIIAAIIALAIIIRPSITVAPIDTGAGNATNTPDTSLVPKITGDMANLVSISIKPGDTLSGTVTVTGALKGGYFFEANAVGMFLDANKNIVTSFPIAATSDWMTADAVSFAFTQSTADVPKGQGYLRVHNDNPSDIPANDKYVDIPVNFQ